MRGANDLAGHITRCVYSPRLEQNIGFANLPTRAAEIGSELVVEAPDGQRPAHVVPTPFMESKRKISS